MFKLEVGNLSVRTPEATPSFPGSSAHLGMGPTGPRLVTLGGSLAAQALFPRDPQSWPPLSLPLHLPLELCLSLPLTFPRTPGEEALRMSSLIPLTDPSAPRCPLQFHLPCHLPDPTALFLCCSNSCPLDRSPKTLGVLLLPTQPLHPPLLIRKATLSCTPPCAHSSARNVLPSFPTCSA